MEENNKENLLEELNEVLGEERKDADVEGLVRYLGNIKDRMDINEKMISSIKEIKQENVEVKEAIETLIDVIGGKSLSLPEVFNVEVKNPMHEVSVSNIKDIKIPEPKDEVKINNLPDIPSYKGDFKALAEIQSAVVDILINKELKSDLDRYTDAKRPLAVRLSDGKGFYEAISSAISTAMEVFKDGSNVAQKALVDASGHLQVDVLSGGGGGTLITNGEAVDVADTGSMVLGTDGSNYRNLKTDADGHLQIDVLSGATGGTQYTEGDTDTTITGTAILWEDTSDTLSAVSVSKPLPTSVRDTAGNDLELVKQADNFNSANHGMVIYGVDEGTPQKYRQMRMNAEGDVHMVLSEINDVEPLVGAGNGGTGSLRVNIATDDVNASAIKTAVELIDNAISGNEMQVDVVGALPAGTNAIGKLASNSGVDIGDVTINNATTTPVYSFPADFEFAGVTTHVKKYYTNSGAVTDGIVWSPASGKRWYVTDIIINVSASATVTLEDDLGAGDSAVFKAELAGNSGISHSFNTPLFSGEDGADLLITTSAGNVYVCVTGYEI